MTRTEPAQNVSPPLPPPPPIVPPADFPVTWADPADEERLWQRDRMHWPDQATPLTFSVMEATFGPGFGAAARGLRLPLGEAAARRINTYLYMDMAPRGAPPDAGQAAAAEEAMRAALGALRASWEEQILPEIHQHLRAWEAFDLEGASLEELRGHLDETVARFTRLIELHFLAVFPAYLAVSELDEVYRDLLGGPASTFGAFDAYKLVQGLPNKTVEVGHALWRLSRAALGQADVRAALEGPAPAGEVVRALKGTEAGGAFLSDLREYLEAYGQRGDKFFDLEHPSWVEDPSPVFDNLRVYLTQPDDADPAAAGAALAVEREEAVAATRARLAGYPEAARGQFEFLLAAAQVGVVITEDHGFWIDFRSSYKVRRVLVEMGRRLHAGGALDHPDDVFMLSVAEVRETAAADPMPDRRALVAERKAEMDRFAGVRPPDRLGTPPPPVALPDNAFMRSMAKFWGGEPGGPEVEETVEPGIVRGMPGSPGRVKGVARIIRNLSDADRLQPGDVLVAETTTPPWTPLFAVAGAVVTDTGGVLSHCAVVAREYGLPAVVGTRTGSDRIRDGEIVEVDGDAGLVHFGG
ncbi:MAG TPA: PEP-utilizing enzyme [Acidimicrobiia bacterium]|nr:PEP-utilizing enzyme [Acidimicrobiia bacterium]